MLENFRLTVFRAVAAERNFRRAAEHLYLTQPAVTQQIKALEELIGLPLFDRSGREITLTTAGTVLLKYTQQSGAVLEQAAVELAALKGHVSGTLRIAASTTIAQYILPPLLGAFLRLHPAVHVELDSSNTESVADAIATGRLRSWGVAASPSRSSSSAAGYQKLLSARSACAPCCRASCCGSSSSHSPSGPFILASSGSDEVAHHFHTLYPQ
jgi:DNA-binding transcriptional LysR family regulator